MAAPSKGKLRARGWHCALLQVGTILAALAGAATPGAGQPLVTKPEPIPDAVWARMQGRSVRPGLPCPRREDLVLLKVPYRDFAGIPRTGPLIIARDVAGQVAAAFREIYARGAFRIAHIALIDEFGGDDDASLAANNTSAFNCRMVIGTTRLSDHARGRAVDINPVQNPYVSAREIAPPAGRAFATQQARQAASAAGEIGMIMPGDIVVRAFERQGWRWGGTWRNEKDYQHFYAGR